MTFTYPGLNKEYCNTCGQLRDYPTEPGDWEYLENPSVAIDYAIYKGDNSRLIWKQVTIVQDDEGLMILPVGKEEPVWWPHHALWRKR